MEALRPIFDECAVIVSYPREDYLLRVTRCMSLADSLLFPEARGPVLSHFRKFKEETKGHTLEDLEELYTRTFDVNPVCSLELGWHLYGETYERGAFLVQMRDLLKRCGVEESSELPDHISHVLLSLSRMSAEEAEVFVSTRFMKAIDKMISGFADKNNPYEHVMKAVRELAVPFVTSQTGA